jgi:hypothetical protein
MIGEWRRRLIELKGAESVPISWVIYQSMGIAVYVNCSRILMRKRSVDELASRFIHFRSFNGQRWIVKWRVGEQLNLSKIGKARMFWGNAIAEETNRKLSKALSACLQKELCASVRRKFVSRDVDPGLQALCPRCLN